MIPAIDIQKSSTRREDLLLNTQELSAVYIMRKALNGLKPEDATEKILDMFAKTKNNQEVIETLNDRRCLC